MRHEDQPQAHLDLTFTQGDEQARLLVALRERQIEMGLGLIFVSHDMAVVRKVTDRIIVLDAGRVVEEGPSHRVASTPTSAAGKELFEAASVFAAVEQLPDSNIAYQRRP